MIAAVSLLAAQEGPTHVILTSRVAPGSRNVVREDIRSKLPLLRQWKDKETSILGFQILANSLFDDEGWDTMITVQCTPGWLGRWRGIEALIPEGALSTSVTPADLIESGSVESPPTSGGVYLVIPYEYLVTGDEYKKYAKGYVVPQLKGWMKEGVLLSYQLFTARFPAGRQWNALLVLRYRDWAALGQREAVTAKVRAQLTTDQGWKAWSDNKQTFRREKTVVIAEPFSK